MPEKIIELTEEEIKTLKLKKTVEQYLADDDTVQALKVAHIATMIAIGEKQMSDFFK